MTEADKLVNSAQAAAVRQFGDQVLGNILRTAGYSSIHDLVALGKDGAVDKLCDSLRNLTPESAAAASESMRVKRASVVENAMTKLGARSPGPLISQAKPAVAALATIVKPVVSAVVAATVPQLTAEEIPHVVVAAVDEVLSRHNTLEFGAQGVDLIREGRDMLAKHGGSRSAWSSDFRQFVDAVDTSLAKLKTDRAKYAENRCLNSIQHARLGYLETVKPDTAKLDALVAKYGNRK